MIAKNKDTPRFRFIDGQIYVSYDLYKSVNDRFAENSRKLVKVTIEYTKLVCENTNRQIRNDRCEKPVFTIKLTTGKDK